MFRLKIILPKIASESIEMDLVYLTEVLITNKLGESCDGREVIENLSDYLIISDLGNSVVGEAQEDISEEEYDSLQGREENENI